MSDSVVPYLLGKHLTSVSFTPQSFGSGGVLTPGTSATIHALVVDFDVDPITETEDIRGVNSENANAVPVGYDGEMSFEILLRSDANALLVTLWGSDFFVVAVIIGANTITFYGVMTSAPVKVGSHGRNTYRVRLKQFAPTGVSPLVIA